MRWAMCVRLAISLLGGFVAAIGVSWALAAFTSPWDRGKEGSIPAESWPLGSSFVSLGPDVEIEAIVVSGTGTALAMVSLWSPEHQVSSTTMSEEEVRLLLPSWVCVDLLRWRRHQLAPGDRVHVTQFAAGWPMLALSCVLSSVGPKESRGPMVPSGIAVPFGPWRYEYAPSGVRTLPLTPISVGLLLNTITYAITIWIGWSACGLARLYWRQLRGHCPACGYTLIEGGVCSECGQRCTPFPIARANRD